MLRWIVDFFKSLFGKEDKPVERPMSWYDVKPYHKPCEPPKKQDVEPINESACLEIGDVVVNYDDEPKVDFKISKPNRTHVQDMENEKSIRHKRNGSRYKK